MATVRLPALLVLPAVVAAALVLGADGDDPAPPPADAAVDGDGEAVAPLGEVPAAELLPAAAGADARGSTWFCAPGTATGSDDGFAEHVIVMANAGDAVASVSLTVIPDEGDPVIEAFDLEPASRTAIELSDLVRADWAGALIEADGGEVAVDHVLTGPTGTALAPCASTPTDRAWFPAGATEPGASEVLTVLNPFPDEAVISVTFETEDGARTPDDLEAKVVPPRSVVVLELGDQVAVRREVSTTVEVVSGQVVADRIQSYDGTGDRSGLGLEPGVPRPASTWWFPGVEVSADRASSIVLVNPDRDSVAKVDVGVTAEGVADADQPEPFAVEVAPGRYLVVPLDRDGRVPLETGLTVTVVALDDHPVVAELLTSATVRDDTAEVRSGVGLSLGSGSPVAATRWLVPFGSLGGTDAAVISVANPGDDPVVIRLDALGGGTRTTVDEGVVIEPGGQVDLDVAGGAGRHPAAFDLSSDGEVIVSRRFQLATGEVTDALAIPEVDGVVTAPPPPRG